MGNKNNKNTMGTVAVVGLVIAVVVLAVVLLNGGAQSITGTANQGTNGDGSGDGSGSGVQETAELLNTQEISMTAKEKYNPTTAVSPTCTYYESGIKQADTDCTFTVKRGLDYMVLLNASGYVSVVDEFNFDGKPLAGMKYEMADFMAVGSAITVYNKDGSTNTNESTYAIGTGESKNIEFEISGVFEDVHPGGVIVFEVNDSAFMSLDFTLGEAVSEPEQYTASSVGVKSYAFTFPEVESNEVLTGFVSLTAEDVNPGAESITYTIYDSQYFIDSITDEISDMPGVEDSDEVDAGEANVAGTIYTS